MDYSEYSPLFPNPVKCFQDIISTTSNEIVNRSALRCVSLNSHPIPFSAQVAMERDWGMGEGDLGYQLRLHALPHG